MVLETVWSRTRENDSDAVQKYFKQWANTFPELKEVCRQFSFMDFDNAGQFSYTPLESYLQKGPQCGLAALAMYKSDPKEESVNRLFKIARMNGYTNHGEMFSVPDMAALAQSQLESTDVELYRGYLDCYKIKKLLLDTACILVPFDCDQKHFPVCSNGRDAHWAIVCGGIQTKSFFYVFARHGRAKNVALWNLSQLAESNAQLNEVATPSNPTVSLKLPKGGMRGPLGLKNQSIILKRKF